MIKKIRRGVFETNSSSVHTITIMMKSDYKRWCNEDLYLFKGSGSWRWGENHKPVKNQLYKKEEVIEFIMNSKYPPNETVDWNDPDVQYEYFRDNEFYTFDEYGEDSYLETYEEEFITPSGEEIVVFGEYGEDC